jgi:hypothetical protein
MQDSDTVELWSSIFLSDEDSALVSTCSLEKSVWSALMNRREDSRRLFAKVEFEEKVIYIALGSYTECASSDSGITRLILPRWALDVLSSPGMGDLGVVTWLTEEAFPSATRIVLRPHDSAFYHSDAKEELEVALTRIGVLQKGQTILVPIQSLGDYPISFDVVELEPANIVLADGEEVVMEFEAALDQPPDPVERPDTPIPESDFASMIPEANPTIITGGRRLGGTNRVTADGRPWNPHRDT